MNYLCVCQGGNIRSAALAYLLKYRHSGSAKHNAIAVGIDFMTPADWSWMFAWADIVFTVAPQITAHVKRTLEDYFPVSQDFPGQENRTPSEKCPKIVEILIGADQWGPTQGPYNKNLLTKCEALLTKAGY